MQHKIAILAYTTKYFWVLLIPVARTVFLLGFDFRRAFSGAYLDIIAIGALLLYGVLKWRCTEFSVKKRVVILKSGVFLKTESVITRRELSAVVLERTIILRFFNATRVRLYTNASPRAQVLYCKKSQLPQFYPYETVFAVRGESLPLFCRKKAAKKCAEAPPEARDERSSKALDESSERLNQPSLQREQLSLRRAQPSLRREKPSWRWGKTAALQRQDALAKSSSKRSENERKIPLVSSETLSQAPTEKASVIREAKWYSVLFYSLLNSSSLSGALILSASVSQLGRILGVRLDEQMLTGLEDFGTRLQLGLPPLFVTLGLFIIVSWAASFLKNALNAGRFTIRKRGEKIAVTSGVFSLYTSFLTASKINSLDIRRNILSLTTRSGTPYIRCTGYGNGQNELSVAFPSCRDKKIAEITSCFFSGLTPRPPEIKPPKRALFGYIVLPLCWAAFFGLALTAACIFTNLIFLRYLCVVGTVVFLWLLLVRSVAFYKSGISVGEHIVCIRNVRFFALHTVSLKKSRIAYHEITRNPFQRVSGLCDLLVYELSSDVKKRHKIRNIVYNSAKNLKL